MTERLRCASCGTELPAGILACVFIFALYPDIGMTAGAPEAVGDEEVSAPLAPGQAPSLPA